MSVLVFSGCTVVQDSEILTTSIDNTSAIDGDILVATDSAVEMFRDGQVAYSIDVYGVFDVAWFGDSIIWIEKQHTSDTTTTLSSVMRFIPEKKAFEPLYTTQESLRGIDVSAQKQFISFYQDDALMIYTVATGELRRVAQDVRFAAWSPDRAALVFAVSDRVSYAEVDDSGSVVSYVDLPPTLQAFNFVDGGELLALDVDEGKQRIVAIDLGGDVQSPTILATDFELGNAAGPYQLHQLNTNTLIVSRSPLEEDATDGVIDVIDLSTTTVTTLPQKGMVLDIDLNGRLVYRTRQHDVATLDPKTLDKTIIREAGSSASVYRTP